MNLGKDYVVEGQMSIFDCFSPDLWSGKMSPEPSVPTEEKISEPSSKKRQGLSAKMPLFLDLRGGGVQAVASWEAGGALLGAYTMRSFGECPSEEKESRLSQILEVNPLPKYSLSAKACQGILRRAQRRGKKLPELLEKTLIRQSACKETELTEQILLDATGADGEGGGCYTLNTIDRPAVLAESQDEQHAVCFSETASARLAQDGRGGVHSQMMSDPEGNFVLEQFAGVNGDIAGTLDANYYKGCGERQGTEREVVCVGNGQMCNITMKPIANSLDCMHEQQAIITYGLDRASFNQGQNAQYDFSVIEEQAQTLISRGPGGVLTEQ